MPNFPDTGKYSSHQGMFVGEEHDKRDTMDVLIKNLGALASAKVHVILLEYYPDGETPAGKSPADIEKDLKSFNKTHGMGPQISQQVWQLCTGASNHGIDIRGIEQPKPPVPPGKKKPFFYLKWRLSDACNQAFLNCADAYAVEKRSKSISFCMYGGLSHWVKLRKLAPGLIGYRCEKGTLKEIK